MHGLWPPLLIGLVVGRCVKRLAARLSAQAPVLYNVESQSQACLLPYQQVPQWQAVVM